MSRRFRNRFRRVLVVPLAVIMLLALGPAASATHLTSITLGPAEVVVAPGGTASYTGAVDSSIGFPNNPGYGWALTATGGPSGSSFTLSPSSQADYGPVVTPYTLDVDVPLGTAAGSYSVTATVAFELGGFPQPPGIPGNPPTRTASANIYVLAGECPTGDSWFLQDVRSNDPDPFDANGDGFICTKDIPSNDNGNGEGNSANSNRNGGNTSGFHADGHNHKDNNN